MCCDKSISIYKVCLSRIVRNVINHCKRNKRFHCASLRCISKRSNTLQLGIDNKFETFYSHKNSLEIKGYKCFLHF